MLNRQKILLRLVGLAGGEIDRLVLMKWAFLLRHDSVSCGGPSFYDFLPYKHGPFSFALYQEADKLLAMGYLQQRGNSSWALGDVAAPPVADPRVEAEVASISSRFRPSRMAPLLDYVYEKFPAYTVNSKRKTLATRAVAPIAVYTAGYEQKSVDAFLNGLVQAGMRHLVDVRKNPIARRYGFHRSTLSRLCGFLDITYNHVPSLGVPSELRQSLNTQAAYDSLFQLYESTTLKNEQASLAAVATWVEESPSVLVCMEAEPRCCHRSRLAGRLSRDTGLPVKHLE